MKTSQTLFFVAVLGLAAAGCSDTTTSGGGGVSVAGPATLTHGVCAVLTIDYVVAGEAGTAVPAPAPSDQSYTVTAVNGSVFADSACTTPLTGTATIHAGSTSVDLGFIPTSAGMQAGIMVASASNPLLTAGHEVMAN